MEIIIPIIQITVESNHFKVIDISERLNKAVRQAAITTVNKTAQYLSR